MVCAETTIAQNKRTGKTKKKSVKTAPRVAKPAVDPDADLQNKLLQILLTEQENWKEYVFAESNFKAIFPRTPVKKEEKFDDQFYGTMNLKLYMSSGDSGSFMVGNLALPYSITDERVLKNLYRDLGKEFFSEDEYKNTDSKEIIVNEKPALELSGVSKNDDRQKVRMRVFLVKKDIFYTMVMASPVDDTAATLDPAAQLEKQTTDFFNSFTAISVSKVPDNQNVSPVFKTSFADGIFKSEYFNFTMQIPKDWHEISQDDVAGIRESSREVLKQNSNIKLPPKTNERRNIFSFSLKPLGADLNSTIVCNITKKPSPQATALHLSKETEQLIRKVNFYTVTKSTHVKKINGIDFVGFEGKGNLGGQEYGNFIYMCLRKEYALVFTVIYYTEEEKSLLTNAINSITFENR